MQDKADLWVVGLTLVAAMTLLHAIAVTLVNAEVPRAYMDEELHAPQAQRYCRGDFGSWDSRITTFPGLYLWSALLARVWAVVVPSSSTLCDIGSLRLYNTSLAVATVPVILLLIRFLHGSAMSLRMAWLQAAALALLPVPFFTSQLFYTDAGALLGALGTLALAFQCVDSAPVARACSVPHVVLASAAAAAIIFRQTNAVWVCFAVALATLRLLCRRAAGAQTGISFVLTTCWQATLALWPALIPVAAFAAFVSWNGGIVVGHRELHAPVFHFAQVAYLCAVCGAYSAASLVVHAAAAVARLRCSGSAESATLAAVMASHPIAGASSDLLARLQSLFARGGGGRTGGRKVALLLVALAWVVASAACAVLLDRFTIVHPFILADNRHYTFYIWARLLGPWPVLRMGLAPAYVAAGSLALLHVAGSWRVHVFRNRNAAPRTRAGCSAAGAAAAALWLGASAAALLPSPLVEPRYYALPVAIFLLLIRANGSDLRDQLGPPGGVPEACTPAPVAMPQSSTAMVSGAVVTPRDLSPLADCTTASMETSAAVFWAAVVVAHAATIAVTLGVFLWRPFVWVDGTTARFMW